MGDDRILPRVRTNGLVIKELPDETLIYDVESNTAFCLNKAATVIMNACDGRATIADTRRAVQKDTGSPIEDDLIWNTVEEFRQRNLLADAAEPFTQKLVPRRTLLKQAAALGVAVPVVMALAAPPALHAASTCRTQNQGCVLGQPPPCCPNLACVPNLPAENGTFWCQPSQPTVPGSVPLDPNAPPDIQINGFRKSA
jgi:hypothetical protein